MRYILDGYNFLGVINQLSVSDKEAALISFLAQFVQGKVKFTVVFDGRGPDNLFGSRYSEKGIQVIFTTPDESADDFIKRKYCTPPLSSSQVIITNDRDILYHAKKAKQSTMTCQQFLNSRSNKSTSTQKDINPKVTPPEVNFWMGYFAPDDDI